MPRRNRAQRRRAHHGKRIHPEIPLAAIPGILPGLPGGPPYNTAEEKAAVMDEVFASLREMHPGDEQIRQEHERLGMPLERKQRYKREMVPGYGRGVVLGEFEDAREPLPLHWRPAPGGGVVFE